MFASHKLGFDQNEAHGLDRQRLAQFVGQHERSFERYVHAACELERRQAFGRTGKCPLIVERIGAASSPCVNLANCRATRLYYPAVAVGF